MYFLCDTRLCIKLIAIIFLIHCNNIWPIICGECPPMEWLKPCECEEHSITCSGSAKYNLSKTFHFINQNWNVSQKRFDRFVLSNDQIEQLDHNFLHGLQFERIYIINTANLKRISSTAFYDTNHIIEEFHEIGTTSLGSTRETVRELFDALSSLVNVKWIHFESNTLKSIPSYAFNSNNQEKLTVIDFVPLDPANSYGEITKIGDYMFYHLNNLLYIEISYQEFRHVPKNAFAFELASNKTLTVDLSDNHLNESSFEFGVFLNSGRPLYIHLWNNDIAYLDESVFLPILRLDKRNVINMGGTNPFQCDCRSKWIVANKQAFISQLENMDCRDERSIANNISFWDLTENDLQHCL